MIYMYMCTWLVRYVDTVGYVHVVGTGKLEMYAKNLSN